MLSRALLPSCLSALLLNGCGGGSPSGGSTSTPKATTTSPAYTGPYVLVVQNTQFSAYAATARC